MSNAPKITPFLWFDNNAEEAVEHYMTLFPGSRVDKVSRAGAEGKVLTIAFEVASQKLVAMNGGPHYKLSPAFSLFVSCESQQEVDDLWKRILESGGKESRCGWITDKFGLSWQIIPTKLVELMTDPDPARAGRVANAMMGMVKIDIAGLERAYAGK